MDLDALFAIFADEEVNTYLPWFPLKTMEAAWTVIKQVKKDGLLCLTAIHDRENPRSGQVLRRLGMLYQYFYEEQWQPKDIPVLFRMYQLNLDGRQDRVYRKYWDRAKVRLIEADVSERDNL